MQASKYVLSVISLILTLLFDLTIQNDENPLGTKSDDKHIGHLPIGQLNGLYEEVTTPKPPIYHTYKNYQYSPPNYMLYMSNLGILQFHPVYKGIPPTYVYQYKDSGSKYSTLLTGLALWNLGKLTGTANANHKAGDNLQYKTQQNEVCKFAVRQENGDYEETKIDCQIISSFIYEFLDEQPTTAKDSSQTITTKVTNSTEITNNNGIPQAAAPATTLANAQDVKGEPIALTNLTACTIFWISSTHTMNKMVPCGLIVKYSNRSILISSADRNGPAFAIIAAFLAFSVAF